MSKCKSKTVKTSTVYVGEIRLAASDARGAFRVIVHDRKQYNDLVRAFRLGDVQVTDMRMAR